MLVVCADMQRPSPPFCEPIALQVATWAPEGRQAGTAAGVGAGRPRPAAASRARRYRGMVPRRRCRRRRRLRQPRLSRPSVSAGQDSNGCVGRSVYRVWQHSPLVSRSSEEAGQQQQQQQHRSHLEYSEDVECPHGPWALGLSEAMAACKCWRWLQSRWSPAHMLHGTMAAWLRLATATQLTRSVCAALHECCCRYQRSQF